MQKECEEKHKWIYESRVRFSIRYFIRDASLTRTRTPIVFKMPKKSYPIWADLSDIEIRAET